MRTQTLATLIVIATGTLWGVYWMPVRALSEAQLPGPWGTLLITLAAMLALLPFGGRQWNSLRTGDPIALACIAFGGAAFALYSIGLIYGRVALIILLFFLTPVWSTLIGRYVMGWPTPALRYAAIGVGLAGLAIMLSASGGSPLPSGLGEWMALVSGMMWAISTTGIRVRPAIPPVAASFLFATGATVCAAICCAVLTDWPDLSTLTTGATLPIIALTGGLWWGASMAGLMWAATQLDPARVGILLMAEVVIGSVTAALFAHEALHPLEIAGGGLVILAALLEVWPTNRQASTDQDTV